MARITGLQPGLFSVVRSVASGLGAGSLIVADSGTLSDANYPVAQGLNCRGYETIFVGCEITAGTNPTMTLGPLFRDDEAADQQRWKKLLVGAPDGVTAVAAASVASQVTTALAPFLTMHEIRVYGHPLVFIQITAVTNATSTDGWKILAMPGRVRPALNR